MYIINVFCINASRTNVPEESVCLLLCFFFSVLYFGYLIAQTRQSHFLSVSGVLYAFEVLHLFYGDIIKSLLQFVLSLPSP